MRSQAGPGAAALKWKSPMDSAAQRHSGPASQGQVQSMAKVRGVQGQLGV